jgi:hypothetical protein
MQNRQFRFYVRPRDGRVIYGFDLPEAAEAAALEYGEGASVVDTLAKNYEPMLQQVIDGELLIAGVSGWDTGKAGGLERDLIEAVKTGRTEIVEAFLTKGADINARDKNGGSVLHWAVGGGHVEMVNLLLQRGADASIVDNNGKTLRNIALKHGKTAIADLFS